MKYSTIKETTRVKQTIGWVNPKQKFYSEDDTGKITEYGEVEIHSKDIRRNTKFTMLWTQEIKTNDHKLKMILWIIQNMSNKGTIAINSETLARILNCSEKTVRNVRKKLQAEGWIKYKNGVIFINPNVLWKGNAESREKADKQYRSF